MDIEKVLTEAVGKNASDIFSCIGRSTCVQDRRKDRFRRWGYTYARGHEERSYADISACAY